MTPQTMLWRMGEKGVEKYIEILCGIELLLEGCEVIMKMVLGLLMVLVLGVGGFFSQIKDSTTFRSQIGIDDPAFILDAGHGGEDGGAISRSGISESTINLELTLKLDSIMGFLGCQTILTREEDRSMHNKDAVTLREKKVSDLKYRTALAESYPNSTLISIHQNTYPEEKYHGTQVFYAPTPNSQQLAQQLQKRVAQLLQPENTRQEKKISDSVYLMNHVENRAVLIECGFLTNKEEEELLRSEEYQKKMAVVIAEVLLSQS